MTVIFEKGAYALPIVADNIKKSWQNEGFDFGVFHDPPGQEWTGFVHDTDEYVLVANGTVTVSVGSEIAECESGDLVHIPRGAVYSLKTTSASGSVWYYGYGYWENN